MTGIAGANAADIGNAKTQAENISSVQEKVNIYTNNVKIVNESTKRQTKVYNNIEATNRSKSTSTEQEQQLTKTIIAQNTVTQSKTAIPVTKITTPRTQVIALLKQQSLTLQHSMQSLINLQLRNY